jgi:hypothetical protein
LSGGGVLLSDKSAGIVPATDEAARTDGSAELSNLAGISDLRSQRVSTSSPLGQSRRGGRAQPPAAKSGRRRAARSRRGQWPAAAEQAVRLGVGDAGTEADRDSGCTGCDKDSGSRHLEKPRRRNGVALDYGKSLP